MDSHLLGHCLCWQPYFSYIKHYHLRIQMILNFWLTFCSNNEYVYNSILQAIALQSQSRLILSILLGYHHRLSFSIILFSPNFTFVQSNMGRSFKYSLHPNHTHHKWLYCKYFWILFGRLKTQKFLMLSKVLTLNSCPD